MRCHSSRLPWAARRSNNSLRSTRARKVQKTWPRDAGLGLVVDRTGGEQRLCGFEGILHGQQIAVAQHNLESGDFGVGAQHKEAVKR
jgi:hypothetical protein